MGMTSIGDLATSYLFRSRNAQIKSDMNRLTEELASGQTASVSDVVNADFGTLSSIEHSMAQLGAQGNAVSESIGFASAMQISLEAVRTSVETLSTELIAAGISQNQLLSDALGMTATENFHAATSRLNTEFGGRSLFAGTATDGPALVDSETILEALKTAVATETTASGIKTIVDSWFGVGSDFETVAYVGSTDPLAPMAAGGSRQVTFDVTASDPALRDTLRGLALAALIDTSPLSGLPEEQTRMASIAGEVLLSANSSLLNVQARIGAAEETLDQGATRIATETYSMEAALSEILTVDPYDRATRLEQAETQLELLYALTARTSRLKLTDYL